MSTGKDTVSVGKAILDSTVNWAMWNKDLASRAVGYSLWDYIQGKAQLIPKPTRPAMEDFVAKKAGPTPRRQGSARLAEATETTPAEESPETLQEERAESVMPTPRIAITKSIMFTDLTAEKQKAYNAAWSIYQDDLKFYREEQEHLTKLREWIQETVSPHYREIHCEPTETLAMWYTNLKEGVGATRFFEKSNARQLYHNALKAPRTLKDFDKWVDNWERAMNIAKNKDVAATKSASDWFPDLLGAIEGVLPTWTESYEINKNEEVEADSLTFRTVANDLRKVVDKGRRKGLKLAKGSFGPTFADVADQHAADEAISGAEASPESGAKRRRSRKTGKNGKSKRGSGKTTKDRKKDEASSDDEATPIKFQGRKRQYDSSWKVCRACEGFHDSRRCYYLYPDQAPKGWKPRDHIRKVVDNNLRDDPTLEEEAKRWSKRTTRRADKERDDD
jgi:tetratricopeptide (TPR) repeat protein